jgi:hypothetical protein
MDWQPFINVGLGAFCAVFGWVGRTFYTDIRSLEMSIAAHKVEVARDYATNDDLRDINSKLDELLRYVRK